MNEQPRIEKGIPIDRPHLGKIKEHVFHKMKIGDSYLTDIFGANTARTIALRTGKKMTARKQSDGKMRVWRIK